MPDGATAARDANTRGLFLVIFTSLALDRVDLLQEQGTQVFTK